MSDSVAAQAQTKNLPRSEWVLGFTVFLLFALPVAEFGLLAKLGWKGLPVYLVQALLYVIFYGLAWWGLTTEKARLPFNARIVEQTALIAGAAWVAYALLIAVTGLAHPLAELREWSSRPLPLLAQAAMMWLLVGMAEELVFRGYLLRSLQRLFKGRTATAVVVSSLVYSLWHLPNRAFQAARGEISAGELAVNLSLLFVLGLALAYVFVRSRNILLVGLLHGLLDFPLIGTRIHSLVSPALIMVVIAILGVELAARVGWSDEPARASA